MLNYIIFSLRFISRINQLAVFVAALTLLPLIKVVAFVPGDLDPSFGLRGTVVTPLIGDSIDTISDSITQPDGKIIVVGKIQRVPYESNTNDSVVIRYNRDGTLDNSFASNGIKIIAISPTSEEGALKVAIQSDGKIIVAGNAFTPLTTQYDFYLLRLNPDGTEDFGFGSGGRVITTFNGNSWEHLADMVLQPDGKILVVGRTCPESCRYEIALARYNPDGSLDNSFGNSGKVIQIFGIGDDGAKEVELQADGKIVVLGVKSNTITANSIILRYNNDGSLDTSFDEDGYLVVNDLALTYLEIQPDGKYVTAGTTKSSPVDLAIARFNTDGTADLTFNDDGKVIIRFGTFDEHPYDLLLQPDGKILVSGAYTVSTGVGYAFIARFNIDGSFDSTFGSSGKVDSITSTQRLALQQDGEIIAAGSIFYQPGNNVDIALTRFTANGVANLDFGSVGFAYTSLRHGVEKARAVAIQPDNKIVVAGEVRESDGRLNFFIARYTPNGVLDTTFRNGAGYVIASIDYLDDGAYAVAVQPDGKIVVAGYSGRFPNADIAVVRLNPNGSFDNTFGTNGMRIIRLSSTGADAATSVLIQPDGKIVLVGYTVVSSGVDFAVLRLTASGNIDPTFSNDGIVITSVGANINYARSAILQPDGKIVAVGDSSGSGVIGDFALARFNTDGSLDETFGNGGKVFVPLTTNASDEGKDVALQADGKIVVAGITQANPQDIRLTRYNTNGSVDTNFGEGGLVRTDIQGSVDSAESIVVQPNGKIIIAGATSASSESDFAVVRYNADGSQDASFGNNGIVINEYGNRGEAFYAAGLQPNGKLVAIGGINIAGFRSIALLRYTLHSSPYFDFDGDNKTDLSIFRPALGEWWYLKSSNHENGAFQFGSSTDKMTPADFTGDSKTDFAFFRPSIGEWFVLRSEDSSFYSFPFGTNGDVPVPADYDADGRADAAVFRPSTNTWYISKSTGGTTIQSFGAAGDMPVVADYDGDNKADIAIYRPSKGEWWIQRSNLGAVAFQFGNNTDKPVQGDFTGDGKADVAFFRPQTGEWFILRSENNSFYSFPFGTNGDAPTPGDYDGDRKSDAAVFRPSNNTWFIQRSTSGTLIQTFGQTGDKPVPNAFVP